MKNSGQAQQKHQFTGNFLFGIGEPVLNIMQLRELEKHKYSCHSSSFVEPFMQPAWNWLVAKFPLWLAPNLITITGLAINIVTSLLLVYFSPDGKSEVPRWSSLACAVGLFIYQTLDAVDGKQARRTGSSSPLGELFDHGCDSLSIVFVSLAACISAGLGSHPWWIFFQCFAAFTLFYCAHWQAYVSGMMKFGKFDVTEAQFGIILIHLATSVFGSRIWNIEMPVISLQLKLVCELIISGITVYNFLCEYILVILQGGCGKNGSTVAVPWLECSTLMLSCAACLFPYACFGIVHLDTVLRRGIGKNGSTVAVMLGFALFLVPGTSVLSPAIPLVLVLLPGYLIAWNSKQAVFEAHPALYIITFGLVAAKITNKLVVAHMCKSELEYWDRVLLVPFVLLANQHFDCVLNEHYLLWFCLVFAVWDLLGYCTAVCLEICYYSGLELFRIKPREVQNASTPDASELNKKTL